MKAWAALATLLVALLGVAYSQEPPAAAQIVADDPRQLVAAALALARSPRAEDHRNLSIQLRSAAYLTTLDSPAEYLETGSRLRIARVIEALAQNAAPSAHDVLLELAASDEFASEARRVDFLLRYSAALEPTPPLVAFWDRYSQPLDGFTPLTIQAITTNGREPALALLERKLADERHGDDDKQYWMRSFMLPHRNEVPMLRSVERLLSGGLPAPLRPDLVEAIFDYQPDQWYSEHAVVPAPDRKLASPEAKGLLRRIGALALASVELSPAQRERIESALREIEIR